MNYEEFASDLPADRTVVFTSVEESEEMMKLFGIDQRVRQLGKGKFRSDVAVRSTGKADLFADRFSTAVSMHLDSPAGGVVFLVSRSASGRFLASGEKVGNEKLIFLANGSGMDIVGPALIGSEDIAIPEARFTEMTETICPTAIRPEKSTIIEGNTAMVHALRMAILDLITHPELGDDDEDLSNLLAAAIALVGHASEYRGAQSFTANPVRKYVAKRAQEFIEERYDEPVHIEDLCRETGAGVRTLQRCFREYFDITISEYLKTVRLDAAHRDLDALHPSYDTVTAIALQHGFTHLGRFSVEFRERFGESPSELLAMHAGGESRFRESPATRAYDAARL